MTKIISILSIFNQSSLLYCAASLVFPGSIKLPGLFKMVLGHFRGKNKVFLMAKHQPKNKKDGGVIMGKEKFFVTKEDDGQILECMDRTGRRIDLDNLTEGATVISIESITFKDGSIFRCLDGLLYPDVITG